MPKLPQVSGNEIISLLKTMGYTVLRQKGSHVRLRKVTPLGEHKVTVPTHKVLAKGTLNDILTRISLWNSISKQELLKKL